MPLYMGACGIITVQYCDQNKNVNDKQFFILFFPDVSPSVLNIPNSNRHSVYVDQRGRTSLKQSRELPV